MKNGAKAGSIRAITVLVLALMMVASTITISVLPTNVAGAEAEDGNVILTDNETIPGQLEKTFLEVTDFHAGAPVVYLNQDNSLFITVESTAGSIDDDQYISNITQAITDIENLIDENPGNPKTILLQKAIDELNNALDKISDGDRVDSIQPVLKAIIFLNAASHGRHGIETENIVNALANAVKDKVGTVIDEAEHNFGSESPDVKLAKLLYDQALDKLEREKYAVAMGLFRTSFETVLDAYTCDVNLTVIDIIPGQSETIIDQPTIENLTAESEETVEVTWQPTQRGIHYVKLNMTGEYEVYASPGSTAESPPSILSAGFPVSPYAGPPEEWGPGRAFESVINLTNDPSGIRYREDKTIFVYDNLTIESPATLQLNESVTMIMLQETTWPTPLHNITINPSASFIIDSPSRTTTIQSSSSTPSYTYPFHNYGTVDFLGANVTYTYGDTSYLSNPGGIQNHAGSVCNLTDSRLTDTDTHTIVADNSELNIDGLNTLVGKGDKDTLTNKGTGITVIGNSNVVIDNVTVDYNEENGIKCVDADNVVVLNGTKVQNGKGYGIFLDRSNATITELNIHDNGRDGIVIMNGSAPEIEANSISGNDGYGIRAENCEPNIQNNPLIAYNLHGIYIDNVWDSDAKIYNNTVSNNVGNGIFANNTNISIFENTIESNGLEIMYEDDFETDTDWTAEGMWHRVDSGDANAPVWNISYNGDWSYWYGQDSTGNYNNGTRNNGSLTSPEFDVLGSATIALLTFMSWSDVNESSGDYRWVQIGIGSVWTNLTNISGDPVGRWVRHTVDISDFIPAADIQIKFCFDTLNAIDNDYTGWYIDDITVVNDVNINRTNGIYVNGGTPRIHNNTLNQNDYGIYTLNSNVSIENNMFDGNEIAIKSEESYLSIVYNEITNHIEKGLYLINSTAYNVSYNNIVDNGYALHSEGSNLEIFDCNITSNDSGIYLTEDSNASVHNNILYANRKFSQHGGGEDPDLTGIRIVNSFAVVYSNLIMNNRVGIHSLRSSGAIHNNTFYEEYLPEGFHPIHVTTIDAIEAYNLSIYQNWFASWIYMDSGMIALEDSKQGININENTFEGQFEGNITYNFRGVPINFTDLSIAIGAGGSGSNGIRLRNSSANIKDNIINGTYLNGIYLTDSSYASISNNTITNSTKHGIDVRHSTADIINGNYIYNSIRDGIYSYYSSINVSNSTISGNENGIVLISPTNSKIADNIIGSDHHTILNETVYGPSLGNGNDPSKIYLEHDNILNCTLYIDVNGSMWYKMDEKNGDYILDSDTGEIYFDWYQSMDENWTFYAYYNYSDGLGNEYGIRCDYLMQLVSNETVYGPAIGGGSDPTTLHLNYGNIANCTLYLYDNGTGWLRMVKGIDYTLDNDSGEIVIASSFEENDYLYAYYNHTGNSGQLLIVNNTVEENEESGVYISTVSVGRYIINETVYGPTAGNSNDPSFYYLEHEFILDCTLYIDVNGTQWYKMIEGVDYTLDYHIGEIYIDWSDEVEENWIFYAYYNYSDAIGNEYSPAPIIEGNLVHKNLNDGIRILSCNVNVSNNTITENEGSGLWTKYSTGEIVNNTIFQNYHPPGSGGPPQMSGIDLFNCENVYVGYNNISENHVNIYLEKSFNVLIEWNEMVDENAVPITGPAPKGIYSFSSQFIASNNSIWGTGFGIDIENADNKTIIVDNKFYRIDSETPSTGTEIGVKLFNASPIVERNTFDGIKNGIRCYENSNAYIYNNTITNCSWDGIYLEWSAPTIIGNNITGNTGWGIISKYVAPANAGVNGTGLISDNPLLGVNGYGKATQIWELRILVINSTNATVPDQWVRIDDWYNNTVWTGYTNSQGYTEYVDVSQYEIINSTTEWIYTPFQIYTEYPGTPTMVVVEENVIATVHIP